MEKIRQTDSFFYVFNFDGMRSNSDVDRRFLCTLGKALFDNIFIFYWLCWFFIRFTRHCHFPIPYLNSWLTDFVFVPIIVHISSVVGSYLFNNGNPHGYPLYQIWFIAAIVSLVFEWVMPYYTDYNTADLYDVLAYFTGGLFYFLFHQPRYIKKSSDGTNHLVCSQN